MRAFRMFGEETAKLGHSQFMRLSSKSKMDVMPDL